MGFLLSLLILILLIHRGIDVYFFIKKVSKVCQEYDWRVINKNPELLIVKMNNKDYYLNSEWSAYNFLFMKGPSPIYMFLNFKQLKIETQYNEHVINKLNEFKVN